MGRIASPARAEHPSTRARPARRRRRAGPRGAGSPDGPGEASPGKFRQARESPLMAPKACEFKSLACKASGAGARERPGVPPRRPGSRERRKYFEIFISAD